MTDAGGASDQIERWVSDGANHGALVELLVASGGWTEVGAREMVASLTGTEGVQAEPVVELAWPGPLEAEVPPLFAS